MRILILEDDTELADQIAAMLRDENFAVDVTHDGQEVSNTASKIPMTG